MDGWRNVVRIAKYGWGRVAWEVWMWECGLGGVVGKWGWGVWVGSVNGDVWMVECGWGSVDGECGLGSVAGEVGCGSVDVAVWVGKCSLGSVRERS